MVLWWAMAAPGCGDNTAAQVTSPPTNQPTGAACAGTTTDAWVSDPKLCVSEFANGVGHARGLAFAPNGDLFLSNYGITVLADDDHNGVSTDAEHSTFASMAELNHGIAFSRDGTYLYASSSTTVYRWPYTTGLRKAAGDPEIVIHDIPDGGHVTRTLVFDSTGRLYVSVGSSINVDEDPIVLQHRAQIRRFAIPAALPAGGFDYTTGGEVFASGMRNEAGLFIDAKDRIWGVENGRDMLTDNGDIHNDNPGEEINLIDGTGASFYGYPNCYSEFNRPGGNGPGTQWADVTLAVANQKSDDWCRDVSKVHPPVSALPAHWAPLGILEYQGSQLPFGHDLIVASHGSWNADPAVGRVLARVHRNGDAITSFEPIIGQRGDGNTLVQGTWDVRPVDVREAADGSVYFSDDTGGRVFKVTYATN